MKEIGTTLFHPCANLDRNHGMYCNASLNTIPDGSIVQSTPDGPVLLCRAALLWYTQQGVSVTLFPDQIPDEIWGAYIAAQSNCDSYESVQG